MTTSNTLLAHLSTRFTDQIENIAVEALGHILSNSGAARRGLDDVLRIGGVEVGCISRVVTQSTGEERERPDLACYTGGAERILIEAKFWAGLTGNQPVAYLKRLPDDEPSALLFIAPAPRFESLWAELKRLIESAFIPFGETTSGNAIHTAPVGGRRVLVMTSWTALLDHMESRVINAGDGAAQNDIQQLRGLAARADEETLLPMRKEQLGLEFPRFMTRMNQLVDDATQLARGNHWLDTKGVLKAHDENGYGQNIRLLPVQETPPDEGGWRQRFCVNFRLWRDFRETPLWITAPHSWFNWSVLSKKLHSQRSRQSTPIDFVDEERAIPIYLPMGVEYSAVLDDVVQQIKYLSDLLKEE